MQRGQGGISDLAVTTSSEALLSGKAPTFRLLVWAVDAAGEPVPYVTYVVSESFVVSESTCRCRCMTHMVTCHKTAWHGMMQPHAVVALGAR